MNLRPARTAIAVLLTSALLLAGCNDSSDDGDEKGGSSPSGNPSTGATDPTAESSSGSGPATDGGDSGSLDKDSFFETIIRAQQDAGSYRSTSTTSTAGIKMVLESEAIYEGDKILGHAKSTASSPQQIETVVAAGVIYIKGNGLGIPAGKWLKLDPKDPANAGDALAGLAAASDPEVALRAMGELDSLERAGTETIDGVRTRHYRAVTLTANYAKELGLPAEVQTILPPKLPLDVWLDEDNRPVQIRIAFKIEGTSSETEQKYYDYGADLDVDVPKDADTISYSDLQKG